MESFFLGPGLIPATALQTVNNNELPTVWLISAGHPVAALFAKEKDYAENEKGHQKIYYFLPGQRSRDARAT
jgi:hypothetical protein